MRISFNICRTNLFILTLPCYCMMNEDGFQGEFISQLMPILGRITRILPMGFGIGMFMDYFTSMALGFAGSVLGNVTVSTPSLYAASILSASMSSETLNVRQNEPDAMVFRFQVLPPPRCKNLFQFFQETTGLHF